MMIIHKYKAKCQFYRPFFFSEKGALSVYCIFRGILLPFSFGLVISIAIVGL